jgi:hypothetical protein
VVAGRGLAVGEVEIEVMIEHFGAGGSCRNRKMLELEQRRGRRCAQNNGPQLYS